MYVSVVCATFASCCASLYNKPIKLVFDYLLQVTQYIRQVSVAI